MTEVENIGLTPVKDLIKEVVASIEEIHKQDNLRRVLTGFKDLDRILWGFQLGSVNLITSHSNAGKRALATTICKNSIFDPHKNIGVGIVAVPERVKAICREFILQNADKSEQDLAGASLNTASWNSIMTGARLLSESSLTFFDPKEMKQTQDIAALIKQSQIKLLLFDTSPLSHCHPSEKITIRRQMQMIKELAVECNISILLLGDMIIESNSRDLHYPLQLKDISSIDSLLPFLTTVIIVDQEKDCCQPAKHWLKADSCSKEIVQVIVAYNDGVVGSCPLHYQPALKRFSNYSGIDDEDIQVNR